MSDDEVPPGFDDDADNVIAIRHPVTGTPTVIPRELALEESRHYQAYCDWLGGEKWEVIAERHGYADARAAQYDIKQYIESARSLYNSLTAHQAKALQMARLEALLHSSWAQAGKGSLPAINTARQLIQDMVKLDRLDQLVEDPEDDNKRNTVVVVSGDEDDYVASLEQAARD